MLLLKERAQTEQFKLIFTMGMEHCLLKNLKLEGTRVPEISRNLFFFKKGRETSNGQKIGKVSMKTRQNFLYFMRKKKRKHVPTDRSTKINLRKENRLHVGK